MKLKSKLITGALLGCAVALAVSAQKNGKDPSPTPLGAEKPFDEFNNIRIQNMQDEDLGRMKNLGLDLVNGRIVEVLVDSDIKLGVGNKRVAVPATAFLPDVLNRVYRLNVTTEVFKSLPAVSLKHWEETGREERIAASYRVFDRDVYFLEPGNTASQIDSRPKVPLGYVELSSRVTGLPVGNFQGEKFGKVWSMTFDIPNGRILNVIILAPGNFQTKSIVPAMALSFNAERDGLLIDDSKREFADEPRFVFTEAAFGQDDSFQRESLKGPRTSVALEQGNSYRDVDRTVRINQDIRRSKVNGRNVEIGTINDRVTLRGWVYTAEDKQRIGEIAVAASTIPENVDNQILVGKPVTTN